MTDSEGTGDTPAPEEPGFDREALRRKYRRERDKRLRPEGNNQYLEVVGEFRRFVEDPLGHDTPDREAVQETVQVLIVGGGFGGLMAAARLRQSGIDDIRIIDNAGDFGGTWYWNRYPGAQCDVESYIYLPMLEELGYIPREKYSRAPEIFEHARRIGERFDLYRRAYFQTRVTELLWDDSTCRWVVSTHHGDRFRARFVVMAIPPLSRPKLPGIPGIEKFRGKGFHTSRWDYEFTGGNTEGNLHKLRDKRVGVIGTGATAVQCIPYLARYSRHLYVFQRTPSTVDERANRPTDPEWVASLTPGWQKRRMENFTARVMGDEASEDLVNDRWTDLRRHVDALIAKQGGKELSGEALRELQELADFRKMNEVRARVDSLVRDRETAESLKPWYHEFCKRPTFNDDYLATFNQSNVTLVDTRGRGLDRITERGAVFDGTEYQLDGLVFATGFEVGTAFARRAEFEIHGRDGKRLSDHWHRGMRTFHGFYSHGFPNLFHLGLTQTGQTVNYVHMLEEQSRHVAYVIARAVDAGAECVEPTEEAEAAWVGTIRRLSQYNAELLAECTPGYFNNEGQPADLSGINAEVYGGGPLEFFRLLADWREAGRMSGLELS